jgi:hypothetical protein
MMPLTLDEARNAAFVAHPGWPSSDIDNLARGMVASSEKMALLDELEQQGRDYDAAQAEAKRQREADPNASLAGTVGGHSWGSESEQDADNWEQMGRSEARQAAQVQQETDESAKPPGWEY